MKRRSLNFRPETLNAWSSCMRSEFPCSSRHGFESGACSIRISFLLQGHKTKSKMFEVLFFSLRRVEAVGWVNMSSDGISKCLSGLPLNLTDQETQNWMVYRVSKLTGKAAQLFPNLSSYRLLLFKKIIINKKSTCLSKTYKVWLK